MAEACCSFFRGKVVQGIWHTSNNLPQKNEQIDRTEYSSSFGG
jgi:hypothetical protein